MQQDDDTLCVFNLIECRNKTWIEIVKTAKKLLADEKFWEYMSCNTPYDIKKTSNDPKKLKQSLKDCITNINKITGL